jgi:hypothetical protein
MLQKPILSSRVGKWAYALVEYDLHCQPIKSMRGQIVADFIVEQRIDKQLDLDVGYVTLLDGSCILMDRLVEVVVVLGSLLFHLMELVSKLLAGWIINALIIELSMKLSCSDCKFYMTWECKRFSSAQPTRVSTLVVYLFGGENLGLRTQRLCEGTRNSSNTTNLYWLRPPESKTLRPVLDCIDVDDLGRLYLGGSALPTLYWLTTRLVDPKSR